MKHIMSFSVCHSCLALSSDVCRYVRAEVIAGFVNALFLLFISFFIFSEAIEVS